MKISREKPSQRRHHRVNTPIDVTINEQLYNVSDWSLGGFKIIEWEDESFEPGHEFECHFSLPFQGFFVAFHVKLITIRSDSGILAAKFISLDERQTELLEHFIQELVRGNMTSVGDTILRIDSPVTPVSTEPNPNPTDELPIKRWPIKLIAMVYTVEIVEGSGLERMTQNFRRWSGNMLRNGSRALALGPRKVGPFIWWCVLDQRIAMWTMLVSPVVAVSASVVLQPAYLLSYLVWILCSRMALSLFLYRYCSQIYISFPIILYVNQLLNALIKVYCTFRLSKQRWANRGDQSAGMGNSMDDRIRNGIASWVTTVWVSGLVIFVSLYCGILHLPSYENLLTYLSS